MPAVVIAGAVAGAGAIGAAAIGSSAQKKASQQAAQATQNATTENNALAREIYGQNKATLDPYVRSGYGATDTINGLLHIGGNYVTPQQNAAFDQFRSSSGYNFRLNEGQKALNTGWAARGLLNSGAAQKAAISYGQNMASGEFANYLSALSNQQGVGLSAANALAGVSTNYTNQIAGQNNAQASALANSALAQGQGTANLYGTAANALGQIGGSFISSYRPQQNWLAGVGGTQASLGYR